METIKEAIETMIPDALDADEILPARAGYLVQLEKTGFINGVAWAERWIPVEEKLPDFKEHKYVLGRNENQNGFYYAIVYDMKVLKTCYTHWRPIEHE